MSIEDIKEAIEVLEDASAEMLIETGDENYYSEAIAILHQAVKQAQQKTAVSPDGGKGFIDGVWHCQCGKTYEVTCISSKPAKREWFDCTDEQLIAEVRRRGFVIRDAQIEQSEQEPVLWLKTWSDGSVSVLKTKSHAFADRELEPLYSAPPKQWIGLTAEEIWQCNTAPAGHHVECHICVAHQNVLDFAEAIEAKLKEKNCG